MTYLPWNVKENGTCGNIQVMRSLLHKTAKIRGL